MKRERVAAAAVKVRGHIFTGVSHKAAVFAAGWALLGPEDIGFVTSEGRFVSRAEAWKIAKREGQLRRDWSPSGATPELRSEDLR